MVLTSQSGPAVARPMMPAGYGIQTELTQDMMRWDDIRQKLTEARNYWVATSSPDGRPHVIPVWGLWLDESFMFSTDLSSRKGRNLAQNPRLVVHLESGDDVVILAGTPERIACRSVLERFTAAYDTKYQFRPDIDNPDYAFYRLRARTALAWLERDFPNTATRWRFR